MTTATRPRTPEPRRALLITHVPPEPPWTGERRRVAAAHEFLSRRYECEIAVCGRSDALISRLRRKVRRPLAPPYSARFGCHRLELDAYEIIWVFELWALSCVPVRAWRRVLWDKDTVMSDGYRNRGWPMGRLLSAWTWHYERFAASRVRHAFVSFEGDVKRFRRGNLSPLPNGFTLSTNGIVSSSRESPPNRGPRLGFSGLLSHGPNRTALMAFVQEVLPRIRARPEFSATELWIVGSDVQVEDEALLAASPGVALLGYVPELADFYRAIDLAIAPMDQGAGTPTKVIEAIGHGVPVVGTKQSLRGLDRTLRERCVEVSETNWSRAITIGLQLRATQPLRSSELKARYSWPAVFERAVTPHL